jgi:aminoglycoside phosphotransferase (APT) family kinase protein
VAFQPTTLTVDDVRTVVRTHLTALPAASIVLLGEGWDNAAFEVDGELIVRFGKNADPAVRAALTRREARVLTVARRVATVAVPRPVLVVPEIGCLAYRKLPSVPLIEVRNAVAPAPIAAVLGDLLTALYAVPLDEVSDVVEADDDPPAVWRDDAAMHYATVRTAVPERYRPAVEAFLAEPAPAALPERVFAHDDLGIEHVLVDPDTHAVTGVIDWADAALVDPAVGRPRPDPARSRSRGAGRGARAVRARRPA